MHFESAQSEGLGVETFYPWPQNGGNNHYMYLPPKTFKSISKQFHGTSLNAVQEGEAALPIIKTFCLYLYFFRM